MQNLLGSVVLIGWPVVAVALFATQSLSRAILWTLMGAQLALPAGAFFKTEMIPQFDKFSISNLSIVIGCLVVRRRPLALFNGLGLPEILLMTYLISPIITGLLNADPIVVGDRVLPGVGLYDALSYAENTLIYVFPFFIGRQFFRSHEKSEEILCVLVVAGLLYSILMLFEIRMSPSLQEWVYGFAATAFAMTARFGGYRPMVFMGHGLIASFFIATTAIAATTLWRLKFRLFRFSPAAPSVYLSLVLVLCKSFGAILYGVFLIPIVHWTSFRFQMRLAALLVALALAYPALRTLDLFPTTDLLNFVGNFGPDREGSLRVRLSNEDKLLSRWSQKPVFGWGRYGRNRVYDEGTGRDESVTDGLWIITIGQFGLVGFVAQFGLLGICVFRAASATRLLHTDTAEFAVLSGTALIAAISIVELIPNSALLPWTWLICGSLLGRAEYLRAQVPSPNKLRGLSAAGAAKTAL